MTETKQFPEIVLCLQQTFLETAALCANTTSINKQALAQSQAFFRNENSKQCEEESAYPSLWLRILGASPSFLTETDDAIATDCSPFRITLGQQKEASKLCFLSSSQHALNKEHRLAALALIAFRHKEIDLRQLKQPPFVAATPHV